MTAKVPMPGPGCFQWNTGVWFGGQLGGTAWMLAGAVVFALQAPWVAAAWFVCFALANALGTWMWRQRDRLRPFPAYQLLWLVVGISGLLALVALDALQPEGARLNLVWQDRQLRFMDVPRSEFRLGYLFFLVIMPLSMAFLALQEWGAKRQRALDAMLSRPVRDESCHPG